VTTKREYGDMLSAILNDTGMAVYAKAAHRQDLNDVENDHPFFYTRASRGLITRKHPVYGLPGPVIRGHIERNMRELPASAMNKFASVCHAKFPIHQTLTARHKGYDGFVAFSLPVELGGVQEPPLVIITANEELSSSIVHYVMQNMKNYANLVSDLVPMQEFRRTHEGIIAKVQPVDTVHVFDLNAMRKRRAPKYPKEEEKAARFFENYATTVFLDKDAIRSPRLLELGE
jgi:hypothetical protein